MRISELAKQAGLPDGVLNLVTTSRNEAEILFGIPTSRELRSLFHQRRQAHLCHGRRNASACRRLQRPRTTLCVEDRYERARRNHHSFCGCAGERCMALPVVWLRTPWLTNL